MAVNDACDPLGDGISRIELIDAMGDDWSAVRAARVSYAGDQRPPDREKDAKLIRSLLERGHVGVFEHACLTVMVKCPIFVARQWLRHRSWAFNELSRRYSDDQREPLEFYVPTDAQWRARHPTDRQASEPFYDGNTYKAWRAGDKLQRICDEAAEEYEYMVHTCEIAPEQARMILPVNLYTRFYGTCSLRSALHFIAERAAPTAQWETRQFAQALGQIVAERFPVTWAAWQAGRDA